MMPSPLALWIRSTAIATIVTVLLLAALIVGAEEIPALKDWLKVTFYHHWLGKGVLALGTFAFFSIIFRLKRDTPRLSAFIIAEAVAVILSVCMIAGFFLLHTLKIV
ncbi:hypothetical protein A2950_01460 [Candidatus Kaiserbacteria bacterium RIFCSPLOWO2_01_FULL_55_19]|uniref:Uncharacterized protein n=1 Tax=Candidatus Kaiserbacteria bacterium RIFCSPLOWO2_01_FULL_55_19 TaxID=1798516 RepID=A0A1F6ERK9_9BACT|nr:MAG: hypothetical protein A2950_01460 [Candidatus Kaiserbacteria bacterium RIFCSPLOWO2_01_FULL_55_19]